MSILIPVDYWVGTQTVELKIPWITPESICTLETFIRSEHKVLEFGAGGSTLYFSQRCHSVLSFETLPDWYTHMKKLVEGSNVELHSVSTLEEISNVIGPNKFDISLVDICNISRYDLARLSRDWVKPGGIIIVDNYSADYCFNLSNLFDLNMCETFDDIHWEGSGTRIFYM